MLDPRWDKLTDSDWDAFAKNWNAELCGEEASVQLPELPWILDDPPSKAEHYEVPMNFTASPESQWKFILAAYWSGNQKTHGRLAAGPVEHLLSAHGDEYIALIEKLAEDDPLFAKMLHGCWQNQMQNHIWYRLRVARGDDVE